MEMVGLVGGITSISSALPQIFKCIRTRHTKDLSYATNAVSYVGSSLSMYYGISIEHTAIVVCSAYAMVVNTFLLCTKLYFEVLCTGTNTGYETIKNHHGEPIL